MTSYKLIKMPDGTLSEQVQKLPDTSIIPFDPANKDYQEYLDWKAEGNEPEAAD
jgi:hypothetical protein|tara:strand:+ start:302 stop:463 length:162 start_codon:yes stop_codon:yes gene_type:complete